VTAKKSGSTTITVSMDGRSTTSTITITN
jgi:hypothetical protein